MRIAVLIAAILLSTAPAFADAAATLVDLGPTMTAGSLPVVTFFKSDGTSFNNADNRKVNAVALGLTDKCARDLSPQFNIPPNELRRSIAKSASDNLRYAWGECLSKLIAQAYDEGRFGPGLVVIFTAPLMRSSIK